MNFLFILIFVFIRCSYQVDFSKNKYQFAVELEHYKCSRPNELCYNSKFYEKCDISLLLYVNIDNYEEKIGSWTFKNIHEAGRNMKKDSRVKSMRKIIYFESNKDVFSFDIKQEFDKRLEIKKELFSFNYNNSQIMESKLNDFIEIKLKVTKNCKPYRYGDKCDRICRAITDYFSCNTMGHRTCNKNYYGENCNLFNSSKDYCSNRTDCACKHEYNSTYNCRMIEIQCSSLTDLCHQQTNDCSMLFNDYSVRCNIRKVPPQIIIEWIPLKWVLLIAVALVVAVAFIGFGFYRWRSSKNFLWQQNNPLYLTPTDMISEDTYDIPFQGEYHRKLPEPLQFMKKVESEYILPNLSNYTVITKDNDNTNNNPTYFNIRNNINTDYIHDITPTLPPRPKIQIQ